MGCSDSERAKLLARLSAAIAPFSTARSRPSTSRAPFSTSAIARTATASCRSVRRVPVAADRRVAASAAPFGDALFRAGGSGAPQGLREATLGVSVAARARGEGIGLTCPANCTETSAVSPPATTSSSASRPLRPTRQCRRSSRCRLACSRARAASASEIAPSEPMAFARSDSSFNRQRGEASPSASFAAPSSPTAFLSSPSAVSGQPRASAAPSAAAPASDVSQPASLSVCSLAAGEHSAAASACTPLSPIALPPQLSASSGTAECPLTHRRGAASAAASARAPRSPMPSSSVHLRPRRWPPSACTDTQLVQRRGMHSAAASSSACAGVSACARASRTAGATPARTSLSSSVALSATSAAFGKSHTPPSPRCLSALRAPSLHGRPASGERASSGDGGTRKVDPFEPPALPADGGVCDPCAAPRRRGACQQVPAGQVQVEL